MPLISVPQLNKKISCNKNENLMEVLQKNNIPVASSCLGDGICGKCVLEVKFNKEITLPNILEQKLNTKYKWSSSQRASCQVKVASDITVKSTYW